MSRYRKSLSKKALTKVQAVIVAVIIVGAVIAGVAYYYYSPPPPSGEIVIGATMGLTGWPAKGARETLRGYELWVRDINERGGLLGRTVRLKVYDDEASGETGRTLMEKLITVDKVDLILGTYGEAAILTGSDVAKKYGIIYLNAGSSATATYERGNEFLFCTYPGTIDLLGQNTFDLIKHLGAETIAIVNHADTVFGETSRSGMLTGIQRNNLTLVADELYPVYLTTDMKPIVLKIQPLNPDVLVVGTFYDDALLFIRALKELNWYPKAFVSYIGPSEPEFRALLGDDCDYIYYPTMFEVSYTFYGAQEFVEKYRLFYGEDPSYHTACGYATAQILEAVVNATQTLDGNAHQAYLHNTDTPTILTVIGPFKFDDRGINTLTSASTAQWQDGQRYVVWPPEQATAEPIYPAPSWAERP